MTLLSALLLLPAAGARAVAIDTVPVGNGGNAPDPLTGNRYGAGSSSARNGRSATFEFFDLGFRVTTVPEPSTFALAALGAIGLFALGRRRGCRAVVSACEK